MTSAGGPGLAVGTRVRRESERLAGTVMSCPEPGWSFGVLGLVSVRLDNGIWQICQTRDLIVLTRPEKHTNQ